MSELRKGRVEFLVHNEIVDWFIQLVSENSGADIHAQCKSNNGHFTTPTEIEFSGDETKLNETIEFIQKLSDITSYKMPWLNEYTYYVRLPSEKEWVEEQLKPIMETSHSFTYNCTTFTIIRSTFYLFHFRSDLDVALNSIIDKIFKFRAGPSSLFITYPKTGGHKHQIQSSFGTNILTAFHGKFLYYLGLEDILSLEMANKTDFSCWDDDLDHDIQQFLYEYFFVYYKDDKASFVNLREFRSPDVLCHFIKKCHASLNECFIPNILTAAEIQQLSHLYNIRVEYHDIFHIDFRPTNENEIVHFCAVYHTEPNPSSFLDFGPKYATQNFTVNFNLDDSLDVVKCSNEFIEMILKSGNNCSPSKTNAVLRYVTDNFMMGQFPNVSPSITLYGFDLNHVPNEIFDALLNMTRHGQLIFEKINFDTNTLIMILGQSQGNCIELKRCKVNVVNSITGFTNESNTKILRFCDMDIRLNILSVLKNIDLLDIYGCRILTTNCEDIAKLRLDSNEIHHCAHDIYFESCAFSHCDIVEPGCFSVGHNIGFGSTEIKIHTVFEILQNCLIQNRILFDNCHFRFENDQLQHFDPKPVEVIFKNTSFDLPALYTFLKKMHNMSSVWLINSYIYPTVEHVQDVPMPKISIEYIEFIECRLETQTLLNILGSISTSTTKILIKNCILFLNSNLLYHNSSVKLTELIFKSMQLTTNHLAAILNILDEGSIVNLYACEIVDPYNELCNFNQTSQITVCFYNMSIDLQMAIFQQKRSTFGLIKCNLLTDLAPNNLIEPNIVFQLMKFDSVAHLKLFANFSETSGIKFINSSFDFTSVHLFPNVLIKSKSINFENVSFDLEVLVTILERISYKTVVKFIKCNIRLVDEVFAIRPIRIQSTYFENLKLDVALFIRLCKNFTNLSCVELTNCKMMCSKPQELPDITLDLAVIYFKDMEFDVNLFKTTLQTFSKAMHVIVENCDFIPETMSSNRPLSLTYIEFYNVEYSLGVLQVLQNLNGQCVVNYEGQISSQAIIEICTKTVVYGERLRLPTQHYDSSMYFELFAEYFQPLAKIFDPEKEYDLPAYLIPYSENIEGKVLYSWEELKVKLIAVDDMTVKLDFIHFGKSIDLFYLLNDLPDDSHEQIIDYS